MSFGWSASDVAALAQLAWRVVQNARRACGEHDEVTGEVFGLHIVLRRLEKEAGNPESILNRSDDSCGHEIEGIANGCQKVLGKLDTVLDKYGTLSQNDRSARRLWHKIKFGNGELVNVRELREKATYYTSALSLYLNMVSLGSMGRVEKHMEDAGGDLKEVKNAVNSLTAHLMAKSTREGSVLTSYLDDDKKVWKDFRRELVHQGFASSFLHRNKDTIKAYFEELGSRGMLDDPEAGDSVINENLPLSPTSPPFVASPERLQERSISSSSVKNDARGYEVPLRNRTSRRTEEAAAVPLSVVEDKSDIKEMQLSTYGPRHPDASLQERDAIDTEPVYTPNDDRKDPSPSKPTNQRDIEESSDRDHQLKQEAQLRLNSTQFRTPAIVADPNDVPESPSPAMLQLNSDMQEYARWKVFADNCLRDEAILIDDWDEELRGPKSELLWSEKNFLDLGIHGRKASGIPYSRFVSSPWGTCTQYDLMSFDTLLMQFDYRTRTLNDVGLEMGQLEFETILFIVKLVDGADQRSNTTKLLGEPLLETLYSYHHSMSVLFVWEHLIQDCQIHMLYPADRENAGRLFYSAWMRRWSLETAHNFLSTCLRRGPSCDFDPDTFWHAFTRLGRGELKRKENPSDNPDRDWTATILEANHRWKKTLFHTKKEGTQAARLNLSGIDCFSEPDCFSDDLMDNGQDDGPYRSAREIRKWLKQSRLRGLAER